MTFTRTLLVTTATLLAMSYGAAEAAQIRSNPGGGDRPNVAFGKFFGGTTKPDTCDQSYPSDFATCNPESLEQRCDDAGGGMSSEPGGGIDCDTSFW